MMTKVKSLIVTSVVLLLLVSGELESFCQEQVQIDLGQDLINDIDENRIQIGIALQREIVSGQRNDDTDPDGATLKEDPDLEEILAKAQRYVDDENYPIAAQLYQAVLDRSGDTLYSEDGDIFFSLVHQVERILATLPPKGLKDYRIKADAEAAQILAEGRGPLDEQSLSRIVRSYFVSSLGDDSAYKLACIYLDKHNFIGAQRLLRKILEQHPDPSIPIDEILVRISLCNAIMGNKPAAQATLEQARENSDGSTADLINMVNKTIGTIGDPEGEFALGTSGSQFSTYRVMPALPAGYLDNDLVSTWQLRFEPSSPFTAKDHTVVLEDDNLEVEQKYEKPFIRKWRKNGWRPAGDLLFDNGRVFYKSPIRMTSWDSNDLGDQPIWKSVWTNQFPMDDASKTLEAIRLQYRGRYTGNEELPSQMLEVQLFGDRVYHQTSIHNGTLYTIEGQQFEDRAPTKKRAGVPYNTSIRRSRSNSLVAYDSKSGKVLWTLPQLKEETPNQKIDPNAPNAEEDELNSEFILSGGFMASPIGFDNLLLVPVNSGGAIIIYALDANQNGKTVWKSFLCDEPDTGAVPWAPIKMSLNGSDLIVTCGMGVVFVMDASTGLIQFAKRYPRIGERDARFQQLGWNIERKSFDGWSADEVIPYRNQMICFCSDTNMINAFDRGTGNLIWQVEMAPVSMNKLDYILGIQNDVLYAAGSETIMAFDLQGEGLMLWGGESLFDGKRTCGRGMLTPDGIYMPIEDSIWMFDLEGKSYGAKRIASATVELKTGAPVGNLYSDGKRIWVLGGNRVYALDAKPN